MMAQAAMGQQEGGHSHAVSTLVPAGQFLVSADFVGTIKVPLAATNILFGMR